MMNGGVIQIEHKVSRAALHALRLLSLHLWSRLCFIWQHSSLWEDAVLILSLWE